MTNMLKELTTGLTSSRIEAAVHGQGQRGGAGEAGAPLTDPPLLIGGLISQKPVQNANTTLTGIGHDWLTVSVSSQVAEQLMLITEADEPGYKVQGFEQSERRLCMGGICTRRWMPYTQSKRWGKEYESWVFSGATARFAIEYLLGKDCKPTRIDIAFDYDVHPDLFPSDVESLVTEICDQKGIKLAHVGPAKGYTLYVGARTSERMIRFYRRDLKDPLLALEGAHILRAELELKGDLAAAYWRQMSESGSTGFEVASMHILDMIELAPWDQIEDLPEVRRVQDETDAAQLVFKFIKQNAVMIEACNLYGLDIQAMARIRLVDPSPMQESRLRKKLTVMAGVPTEQLQAAAEYWLNIEEFKKT